MNQIEEIINKALENEGIEPDKFYPLLSLYRVLLSAGLTSVQRNSFNRDWLGRKMEAGLIVLPPKPPLVRWRITGKQIKDLAMAFAPGGKGHYHYYDTAA